MENLAPIALFVYNRPDHTLKTLDALKQNKLASATDLFVFSDAAKTDADAPKVESVRSLFQNLKGFKSVHLIQREKNYGLANSIIAGVTDLVNKYNRVVVFEDDLESSPYTLNYFNDALEKYRDKEKVMHVSAYMYPIDKENELPETFFYRVAHSWGWATWKEAWQNFNPNIDDLMQQFDTEKIHRFSIEGKMNFWNQMKEFKAGKNNSWAIRWYASMFLKDGLSLNPSHSLIHNIGHDGSGVHSNRESMYDVAVRDAAISQFPREIEENQLAYKKIKAFLANRKGNIRQRLFRFVQKKLG